LLHLQLPFTSGVFHPSTSWECAMLWWHGTDVDIQNWVHRWQLHVERGNHSKESIVLREIMFRPTVELTWNKSHIDRHIWLASKLKLRVKPKYWKDLMMLISRNCWHSACYFHFCVTILTQNIDLVVHALDYIQYGRCEWGVWILSPAIVYWRCRNDLPVNDVASNIKHFGTWYVIQCLSVVKTKVTADQYKHKNCSVYKAKLGKMLILLLHA
jgi:hypothetical protein